MVLHAMANTADVIIPFARDELIINGVPDMRAVTVVVVVHLVVYAAIALVVVVYSGPAKLTRGALPDWATVVGHPGD